MRLPDLPADGWGKTSQVQFGGYNHTPGAGDGELWDMENLTGDAYPYLSPRKRRGLVRTISAPGGIGAENRLFWVDGDGFYYDGQRKGTVSAGKKVFACMSGRIIIFPDKKVYTTKDGKLESLEASVSAAGVTFKNGTLYGEEAEANTVTAPGVDFSACFSEGDAVEISGCTKHPENNKTPVIREIDGGTMRFYENVFTLDMTAKPGETEKDEPVEVPADYTEPGTITFARKVPDMDYLCVNENRLWGCKGDTIYCSKLGDPKNFNVFDGLGTDSFSVDAGSGGDFTGCVSFLGYPCFFKERNIYKMYGDLPANFQLMGGPDLGVKEGCAGSLAIAGNTMFYLSVAGIMAWSGGVPTPAGEQLGGPFTAAAGGSDGLKYYVSMLRADNTRHLFVYDTQRGLWHREDGSEAAGFAALGDALYLLKADGTLWDVSGRTGTVEAALPWMAEFADFDEGSPEAKGYGKLQIRLTLEAGSWAEADLKFDSEEQWRKAGRMAADRKRSFLLPVIPRRADHCRLRLRGEGEAAVVSVARQVRAGSENKTIS